MKGYLKVRKCTGEKVRRILYERSVESEKGMTASSERESEKVRKQEIMRMWESHENVKSKKVMKK